MILAIAGNELKRMFYSPLAWAVLAVSQFILAFLFLIFVERFTSVIQPQFAALDGAPGVADTIAMPLLMWTSVIMLGVAPLLTMRLFSEERQQRTLALLTSAPIGSTQIVLGKYLGVLGFILLMIAMITLMPLSLALGTDLDWGKLAAGVLGLSLLIASFAAAGLYLSALSTQPIVAAIGSFGLLLFLVILYIAGKSQFIASELFIYLSHYGHFLSFLSGNFNSADLAYYALFILSFVILSIRKLDNERLQR